MTPNTTADTTAKTAGGGGLGLHVRHVSAGLLCLYDEDGIKHRDVGVTPGWDFKDRDEFIARYNAIDTLRAQLEAAELRDAQMRDAAKLLMAQLEAAREDVELLKRAVNIQRGIKNHTKQKWDAHRIKANARVKAAQARAEAAEAEVARLREIDDESPSFKSGFDLGRAESEYLVGVIKNPVCVTCGASSPEEAETMCRPSGDSCPGTEWPLEDLWDLAARTKEAAP